MSDVECQHGLASKKAWTTSSHWPSNFFVDGDCVKILVMMIPYIYYIEFFRQETWRQAFQRCWLARRPGFVNNTIAQCVVCKVRCHCILYGPGIRYSDIFGAPGIRYSVIIKSCALLQTGHLETVHAPVADTVAYFGDLDAPVVDTVTYFGGNHRSRVRKSLKLKKVYFPHIPTSWDKYMFNRIVFFKF